MQQRGRVCASGSGEGREEEKKQEERESKGQFGSEEFPIAPPHLPAPHCRALGGWVPVEGVPFHNTLNRDR